MSEISKRRKNTHYAGTIVLGYTNPTLDGVPIRNPEWCEVAGYWERRYSQLTIGVVSILSGVLQIGFDWLQEGPQPFDWRSQIYGDLISTTVRPVIARFGVTGLLDIDAYHFESAA